MSSLKRILITGASSGIGAALARSYAGPTVSLVLWGRDATRLEAAAGACRAEGAGAVATASFDLSDIDAFVAEIEAADEATPFDIAIFNAGLGGAIDDHVPAQASQSVIRMANVNFTVPVLGTNIMAERMARRGGGRIVLIGSISESFPLPVAPLYAGTKAGLAHFADGMALRLARFGVGLTLVSPGFIDTPMSQSLDSERPFLIDATRAAALIRRGIDEGRARIVLPWQFAVLRGLTSLLPRTLRNYLMGRLWAARFVK